jgi:hypothetical protein
LINTLIDPVDHPALEILSRLFHTRAHDPVTFARMQSAAFIGIMHHRGDIATPHGNVRRASVWVEQEVAIAAFIQHVLARRLEVALYLQRAISREGLRQQLRLKPVEFDRPTEVLDDLRARLPSWALEPVNIQSLIAKSKEPLIKYVDINILPWKIRSWLKEKGIVYVEDVNRIDLDELGRTQGIGKKSLGYFFSAVLRHNLFEYGEAFQRILVAKNVTVQPWSGRRDAT